MACESGINVVICLDLGRPALVVKTDNKPLLLLDSELSVEERMEIMARFVD